MNIFRPLELLLLYVFEGCHRLTGNYGISLLLMSLVITAGTYPLYRLADIWKKKEEDIQNKMAVEVGQIKAAFTGNKRFYMLQACYRMHGYRTWYAFRSALGLLIQIPFFFAAYNVLSSYTGYAEESFLCFRDLAAPDGLLFGLNSLPFLMTAVNIASSVIYTRSLRLKENLQLLVLAVVFFVLLYNRPAALLIYWTSNNLLSLVKSLARRKDGKEWILPDAEERGRVLFLFKLTLLWAWFCVQLYLIRNNRHYLFRNIDAIVLLVASVWLFFKCRWQLVRRHFSVYLFLILNFVIHKTGVNLPFLRISELSVPLFAGAVCYVLALLIISRDELEMMQRDARVRPLIVCVAMFLFSMTVLVPLTIYARSPQDVTDSYLSILFFGGAVCGGVYIAIFVLTKTLTARGVCLMNVIFIIILLTHVFNAVLFPLDTGVLMGFELTGRGNFLHPVFSSLLKDIGIGFLVICLLCYLCRHQQVCLLVCTVLLAFNLLKLSQETYRMYRQTGIHPVTSDRTELGQDELKMHSFSRTERNILYICCDMFNSTYIDRIREEMTGFDREFSGFTWYADTLSVSGETMTSLPSLYGGGDYTPLQNNKNEISIYGATALAKSRLEETIVHGGLKFSFVEGIGLETDSPYYKHYMAERNISTYFDLSKKKLLLMLPFFSSLPYVLKPYLYDSGFWLIYGEKITFRFCRTSTMRSLSYLDLLPEISSADSEKGNFLYFRTELSHPPYGIDRDGMVIDNRYPDPEHKSFNSSDAAYYSAKKCMSELAEYFAWMKRNGVYDNTLIVICSDHGNSCNDNGIPVSDVISSEKIWKSRANALFMMKPVGANGDFIADRKTLKSNGDIIASIFDSMGMEHSFSYHTSGGVRFYSFMLGNQSGDRIDIPYATYKVEGSIFDSKSWIKQ
ncbi:MAG: YidC/Oxa1 family membrane protein insertase [Treponema sp.]|nr:YidC/Oxa1 family membrane protein insertase [Treponema sp.]